MTHNPVAADGSRRTNPPPPVAAADDIATNLITMLLHPLIVSAAGKVRRGDLSGARHTLLRAIETLDELATMSPASQPPTVSTVSPLKP